MMKNLRASRIWAFEARRGLTPVLVRVEAAVERILFWRATLRKLLFVEVFSQ